jgi:hypothetical protein
LVMDGGKRLLDGWTDGLMLDLLGTYIPWPM